MKLRTKIFLSFFISGLILTISGVYFQYQNSITLLENEVNNNLRAAILEKSTYLNTFINEGFIDIDYLLSDENVLANIKDISLLEEKINETNYRESLDTLAEDVSDYIKENSSLSAYDLIYNSSFQNKVNNNKLLDNFIIFENKNLVAIASKNKNILNTSLKDFFSNEEGLENVLKRSGISGSSMGFTKDNIFLVKKIGGDTSDGLSLSIMTAIPQNKFLGKTVNIDSIEMLQNFTIHFSYKEIILLNKFGSVFWSSNKSDKLGVNFFNDTDQKSSVLGLAISEAYKDKKPVISSLDIIEGQQVSYFYLVSPVFNQEDLSGFLVAKLPADNIFEIFLRGQKTRESEKIYLIDKNDNLITPVYTKDGKMVGKKILSYATNHCKMEETNLSHTQSRIYQDFLNNQVIGQHYYFNNFNWCAIAEIDKKGANLPGRDLLFVGLIIGGVITILVFLLGIFFGEIIAGPIEVLRKGVEKVEAGNLNFKILFNTKDEIGDLELAFKKMVDRIKMANYDIEKKVNLQTQEITRQKNILEKQQKAVLNILEDINEEKEKLSQEKDKINTILLSIGDGVFVVNSEGDIIVFNHVASEITGFKTEEALGKKYRDVLRFVLEKTGKYNYEFIEKAISTGKIQTMQNHTLLVKKDGSLIPVADSAAPLQDSLGNTIGCVVVFRDVTKEREIDTMKSEFISVASHQLKTPLTGIRWFSEFLLKGDAGKLNKDQLEFVKQIYDSNERMINLVSDLLNVSHIETGRKFVIEKNPTDLLKTINDVIKENVVLAEKKKIKVIGIKAKKGEFVLNIDEPKIKQVINNLLSNALKYSQDGGQVKFGCEKTAKDCIFYIEDNGLGIPKNQQKRVFQKFFRADNAISTQTDGTGLGLYIAKAILEAHDGKIWFESVQGKGTKFYFSLPIDKK